MSMHKRGFTIFFAVLVASLAMAVGLAIYDLLSRELVLSQTATQSQYAIYAADTGVECALYWDSKFTDSDKSAFATSSNDSWPSSGVPCVVMNNGSLVPQDIALYGTPPATFAIPPTNWTAWTTSASSTGAVTTFTIVLGITATSPCAQVVVNKFSVSGGPVQTNVVSHGYNTCSTGGVVRLERALQVSY